LLFVPAGTDPTELGNCMFAAWSRRLVSLGMQAPSRDEGGLDIKRLDLANAAADVAEYLAKGHYEEVNSVPAPVATTRSAALELASVSKQARGANRTPFQILADFVANGEAADADLWREWENGSKGRRAITWSRGARDALVIDAEQTDEELAGDTDGGGVVVAELHSTAWASIVKRPELLNALLTLVETSRDSDDAYRRVDAALAREGFPGAARRPPDRMSQWAS
jgi:endonuclease/exonuclease/phosphatase (EEP) superfamily protein YafD